MTTETASILVSASSQLKEARERTLVMKLQRDEMEEARVNCQRTASQIDAEINLLLRHMLKTGEIDFDEYRRCSIRTDGIHIEGEASSPLRMV